MAEMKITVELSAEDRARLDAILAELKQARPDCSKCMAQVTEAMAKTVSEAPAPAEEHPVENPFPEPAPGTPAAEETPPFPAPAKTVSLEDIRQLVMKLSRKGADVKEKVKAVVNEYAPKVTQVAEADYPALLEKLEALDAE